MTKDPLVFLPTDGPADPSVIQRAVESLQRGEILALPTETVYGLAVRADDEGVRSRLMALKGSGEDRPFTLHVGAKEGAAVQLAESVCLPGIVERLTHRYWPGPVTLIVQARPGLPSPATPESAAKPGSTAVSALQSGLAALGREGWTGVRAPAERTTAAILGAAPFPVLMTSANLAGEAPAVDAHEVRAQFNASDVPLVLDGGPATIGEASTVLAVGPGRFEVLRQGMVTEEELRRVAGRKLLFVCTGNTCRSPMAEALARHAIRRELGTVDEGSFGFEVASAGVYAGPGAPASANSVQAMEDRGIDLSGHASRPAVDREVAKYDHVYCLTESHRAALLSALPPTAGSRVELLDPEGRDVPDPYGGPLSIYRKTADVIETFINARVSEWV